MSRRTITVGYGPARFAGRVGRGAVGRARDRQALQILCEASVPRDAERERFRALLRGPGGTPRGR